MKKCPNCGASLNPYMVRCEYCRSWVFDWDVLLKDGGKCYARFVVDNFNGKETVLTALTVPHINTMQMHNEMIDYTTIDGDRRMIAGNPSCEIDVTFNCIRDEDGVLFRMEDRSIDTDRGCK